MICKDLNYVHVGNEIIVKTDSILYGEFRPLILEGHLEGNVSQISHLGPRFFHLMKSRNLSCKI